MALGSLQSDFSSDYLTSRTRVAKRREPLSDWAVGLPPPAEPREFCRGDAVVPFFCQEELGQQTELRRTATGESQKSQGGTMGAKKSTKLSLV